MDTTPGIDAHNKTSQQDDCPQNKTRKTWPLEVSVGRHQQQKQPCTLTHPPSSHPIVEEPIRFRLEARTEGAVSSWEMWRQRHCNKKSQRGHLVAVTPTSQHNHALVKGRCTTTKSSKKQMMK